MAGGARYFASHPYRSGCFDSKVEQSASCQFKLTFLDREGVQEHDHRVVLLWSAFGRFPLVRGSFKVLNGMVWIRDARRAC